MSVEPCQLPLGIRRIVQDYHHLHHKGYDIRTAHSRFLTNCNPSEIGLEVWTHPNIFHGHILFNVENLQLVGFVKEEKYGMYSEKKIYTESSILDEILEKIMKLYKDLAMKQLKIV